MCVCFVIILRKGNVTKVGVVRDVASGPRIIFQKVACYTCCDKCILIKAKTLKCVLDRHNICLPHQNTQQNVDLLYCLS